MDGVLDFLSGVCNLLSGVFFLIGLVAIACELWQVGAMQLRKVDGPAENEILLGGAVFVAFCFSSWVLFGLLGLILG
jgi:hypothetical protein